MTVVDLQLARDRDRVEFAIGRQLRQSETVIDVVLLDAALNTAKDQLERAIRSEMLGAVHAWLWVGVLALHVTAQMRRPLERLHRLGRQEALAELERAGYPTLKRRLARVSAPDPDPDLEGLEGAVDAVRRGLPGIVVRIEDEFVQADLSQLAAAEIARALLEIPGARDIASRVVSAALFSGMGATFEEHADLVDGWEWSAVLDAGTCDPCGAGDGTRYATWGEAQADLPGGGPAVVCDGGGRCRCRLVPLGAAA